MRQTERKKLTLSKKAKGFALKLGNTHRLAIHQTYAWLKTQGLWDEKTEEGIKAIPTFDEPLQHAMGSVDKVVRDGLRCMTWCRPASGYRDPDYTIVKTTTVRIRAEHVEAVARLFRLVAPFIGYGQIKDTLLKKAADLEEVSVLDLLVDAQRGPCEAVNLSLRD